MNHFYMNGYRWQVIFVDPEDSRLMDRTETQRVATTDPNTLCIYLSDELEEPFLRTVLAHELSHCVMFSYGLLHDIHMMVDPRYWIRAEEWICNFLANYGERIFSLTNEILG